MSKDFLDIITSGEAVNKGVNLDEKNKHAVYSTIVELSTTGSARNGGLFNVNVKNDEIAAINKPEFLRVLRALLTDKLVGQLFYLNYDPAITGLHVLPCYFANTGKDPMLLNKIYEEVVSYSLREVEKVLNVYKPLAPRQLKEDFEGDFKLDDSGQPHKAKFSFLQLFDSVELDKFDIFPPSRVINTIIEEITNQLINQNKIARLPNLGLIPLNQDEFLIRFQMAEDVLNQKLVPQYKKKTNCRRLFEQITLEEAAHYLEKIVPYTSEFSKRRADIISSDNKIKLENGDKHYAGMLAVETILALSGMAEERFQKQWEDKNKKRFAEIKQNLLSSTKAWQDLVLFVRDEELEGIPKQIWRWLTEDKDLVYTVWYRDDEREHVFLKRDVSVIKKLIEGMHEKPPEKRWQILAVRNVIEQAETDLKTLFEDASIIKKYGRLLRLAYNNYIPWFYKLFFLMNLKFIQDLAFPIAKDKIKIEQATFGRRNEQRIYDYSMEKQREKEKKLTKIRQVENKNKIIEKLDNFYMVQHIIPSKHMVAQALPSIEPDVFEETIKAGNFQIIRDAKARDDMQTILLYPIDQDWHSMAARLRNVLDAWLVVMQGKDLTGEDKAMVARANLVKNHIERKKNARIPKVEEDPYQKLEEAIQAHDQWKMKTNFGRGLANS